MPLGATYVAKTIVKRYEQARFPVAYDVVMHLFEVSFPGPFGHKLLSLIDILCCTLLRFVLLESLPSWIVAQYSGAAAEVTSVFFRVLQKTKSCGSRFAVSRSVG